MKKIFSILILVILLVTGCKHPQTKARWSEDKAWEWYNSQEWPVGCNYVPSYAINQYEMWQVETFDPITIDHELGLAEDLGFNTIRIYLHEGMWIQDKDGFKKRFEKFMDIADSHGLRLIVTFFTNGGKITYPQYGPQPAPTPGIHCSQWILSPGPDKLNDKSTWPLLKEYVQDILRTYKDEKRILYWCLYNEPENIRLKCDCLEFMEELYKWGKEINPSQPFSSPIWIRPGYKGAKTALDMVTFIGSHCDIITFHCYYGPEELKTFIKMLKRFKRPMICQEYMGRPLSTFEDIMPILKSEGIGAINWGLVKGKCNFHLHWSHRPGDPEPEIWFHDIYDTDGTPYSPQEISFIKSMTSNKTLK